MACEPGFDLNPGCWLKSGAEAVATSVVQQWAEAVTGALEQMLRAVGTFWLAVPSPEATHTPAIGRIQADLQWYALVAMVLGLLLCAARMAITSRGEHGLEAVKMLARVVLITGAAMAGMTFAVRAGDAFSKWVLDRALGASFEQSMSQTITKGAISGLMTLNPALIILLGIFAFLGALAMLAAAALRWVALVLLLGFWPLAASLSTTEQGQHWYRKINGWVLAFLLLKPVSAVVYAAGFMLLSGGGATPEGGVSATVTSVIMGLLCVTMAGLTLPALLKLVAPPAAGAAGTSGAAVGGGLVAAGATVATVTATGGAGAAVGGSAGGGSAAASGAPSGSTATGGGGGGSSTDGGGSQNGPTGGGGGGGSSPSGGGGDSSSGGGSGESAVPGGGESPPPSGGEAASGASAKGQSGGAAGSSGQGQLGKGLRAADAARSGQRGQSGDDADGPDGAGEGGQR